MAVSDKPSPVAATGLTGVAALRPLTAAHNVHVVIRLGSTSFSKTTMEKQESRSLYAGTTPPEVVL